MNKRKLIIISDNDPRCTTVAGVGMYANQLADCLHERYDVTFIGKRQEAEPVRKVPYEVIIANERPGQNNLSYLRSLMKLARSLETDDETIIHAQRVDWLWAFRKLPGRKVVTLHGSHAKNMRIKKGRLLTSLFLYLQRKGLTLADRIIAVDHETQKEFARDYPALAHKIIYHPVGVDTSLFIFGNKRQARKELGLPVAAKVFLFVGRLSPEKNVDRMVKAITGKEILLLVGKGELEEELKAQKGSSDVRFIGAVPHDDLPLYFAAADVFLLLSSHEGLPTVVLEAFACGVPAVVTPVGELPHLIREGENGFIIKKDPRKAMDKALASCELMKRACRKSALDYDWSKVAEHIAKEVYEA